MLNHARAADRVAGVAAILACLCWITWAVANVVTHGLLETASADSTVARVAALLTAGWNLLLIPAVLRLHRTLGSPNSSLRPIFTSAGMLSLAFWAFGGLTRITPQLETVYLILASVWLFGLANGLRRIRATTLCQ